jgi:hypothetical protein
MAKPTYSLATTVTVIRQHKGRSTSVGDAFQAAADLSTQSGRVSPLHSEVAGPSNGHTSVAKVGA